MTTPEEAQATGQANLLIENNLSSVKITHDVEKKTGKVFTEWEIKVKHEDPVKAATVAAEINDSLKVRYV